MDLIPALDPHLIFFLLGNEMNVRFNMMFSALIIDCYQVNMFSFFYLICGIRKCSRGSLCDRPLLEVGTVVAHLFMWLLTFEYP